MFPSKSLNKCLTAGITAALTFVWAGAPFAQTTAGIQDQQAAIFADQVKASLLALEDGDRDAPRDHWDPQYIVDEIGIDRQILQHVSRVGGRRRGQDRHVF